MNTMTTPEEAQLTGQMNQMLENDLSSVKITTKVEMKTGKRYTEWELKAKHKNPFAALDTAKAIDEELRQKYGNNTN